jgi:DNA-binding NarL/FixJ family response regulator
LQAKGVVMSVPIRILIADNLQLFSESLTSFLSKKEHLAVVGQASDVPEALQITQRLKPDVVLVGSGFDKSDALELTYEISTKYPTSKLIILGISEPEEAVFEFIESGASGYTLKQSSLDDLLDAIKTVHRGEAVCSPRIAFSVFARIAQLSQSNFAQDEITSPVLTVREEEILQLIVKGLTNKQIAEKLHISFPTVKNHVHNILEKLDVRNRSEARDYALRIERSSA